MAKHRILLIRNDRTFMVNALVSNLEAAELTVTQADFHVKEMEEDIKYAELLILYADDQIRRAHGGLSCLKDICVEHNKKLVLVGSRQENDEIMSCLPAHLVLDAVERPFDMAGLVERIQSVFEGEDEKKKCILLVDDDVAFLQLLKEWLKDKYRIGMARSGMQAITWLAKNNVDLILLDYEMPVTSGPQVFEMLQSESFSKNIPVMFLTGRSDKESIMRVMDLKPAGYLLKNNNKAALLAALEKFFERKKQQA